MKERKSQKPQKFLEKHRNFTPLSITFGLVASVAMMFGGDGYGRESLDYQTHRQNHATLQDIYDRDYITLNPLNYKGQRSLLLNDVDSNYRGVLARSFCEGIVPLVLLTHASSGGDITPKSHASRERMNKYAGFQSTSVEGIERTNRDIQNTMLSGFWVNPAFQLDMPLSCAVGAELKSLVFSNQNTGDFYRLEQSLLASFNRVVGDIKASVNWGEGSEVYLEVMRKALENEQISLMYKHHQAPLKPTLSI